jgi:uncharacterized heparinase superfamily protein
MFKKSLLFFYSIINSKPDQLFHRIRLLIKRKILSNFISQAYALKASLASDKNINISSYLPVALFLPRNHLTRITQDGALTVGFLNQWKFLESPMDWHPNEMKKGTRLWLLNLHYMEFIESLDSDNWIIYIKDWIHANKPYKKGYWLDDWNSYALSIRIVVWMQQYEKRGDALKDSDKEIFLRSLLAQVRFLKSNLELDIGGNHLIKNIKALLWASKFFEGDESNKWNKLGLKLLQKVFDEQITPDGAHFELSPSYHTQVFADFLECYSILENGPQRKKMQRILKKMAVFLHDMTHPDGKISLFGDGGLNMTYSTKECLSIFDHLIGTFPKQSRTISYPDAGFFGLRHKDSLVLIDTAELGAKNLPGHGHGDALSFEYSYSGQRVLIDPGVFEYDEGKLRSFSRSTVNHNTVTLDNKDQSEFWKSFRVGRRARIIERDVTMELDFISVSASHDGYARLTGKPIHNRNFFIAEKKIEVRDAIVGGAGQKATSRFLIAPDIQVHQLDGQFFLKGRKFKILIKSNYPIVIEESICFLEFGNISKTKQIIIDFGYAPCDCKTTFIVC